MRHRRHHQRVGLSQGHHRNRRDWPIKIGTFDTDALARDRDQLWAEAAAREAADANIRLDPSLWPAAEIEQTARTVSDPWYEMIAEACGDVTGKVLCEDVWKIVGVDATHRTQDQNDRIGSAMRSIGFERKRLSVEGKKRWCYARGTATERETRLKVSNNSSTGEATLATPEAMQRACNEYPL